MPVATLEPPSVTASTSIAPSPGAPAPTSSPKPSIAPSTSRPPATPTPTTKKPSERSFDDLKGFADKGLAKPEAKVEAPLKEAKPPETQNANDEVKPPTADKTDKTDKKPETAEAKVEGEAEPQKQGKVWKVLKETETKLATIQKEYEDFKAKAQVDPEKENQVSERIKSMEKREKELIEELRYHNFEKYDEDFQKTFYQPYESQWKKGVREIMQLPVTEVDGSVRAGTADDLSELMALSRNPAKRLQVAKEKFGDDFYRDALEEAKKAQDLFEKMDEAKQEARKTLGEKDAKRREEAQNYHKTVSEEVGKVWQEADKEAFSHEKYGEYFQPKEGDQEGNQRLAKGRALAQRAFTENPFDRKLTPSDRATVVKRQNAVCNRAAAFGRLVAWNKAKDTRIAELEKQVGQYENGEPGGGEGNGQASETTMTMSPSQRSQRDLQKLAH